MTTLKDLLRRLMTLVSRHRFERDLADEMQLHVDLRAAREADRGASSAEAARLARRAFGNTLRFREESRDAWGWRKLDEIGRALRDAARGLLRSRLEWSFIALVLAVGIGTMSGAWTVLQAVLLTPPPYPAVDRLVVMSYQLADGGGSLSGDDIENIKAGASAVERLATYSPTRRTVARAGGPTTWREAGVAASPDLLRVLGIPVASGRDFGPDDAVPGARPTVILSAATARETGAVVGTVIYLSGIPTEVMGITPANFGFPDLDVRFYLPEATRRTWGLGESGAAGRSYPMIARLRTDTTIAAASEQIDGIVGTVRRRVLVQSYRESLIAPVRGTLVAIQVGAGLVLLLTTINVAWLLYARARRRLNIYGLMTALGASPHRLLTSYVAEVFMLALIAVPAAGLIASGLVAGLLRFDNGAVSRWHPSIQLSAMGVALALSMVIAIIASLAGAVSVAHSSNVLQVLRPGRSGSLRKPRRYLLMTAQTAIVVMICVQAVRLMIGVFGLVQSNIGFHHSQLMTAELSSLSGPELPFLPQPVPSVPLEAQWTRNLAIYKDVTRAGLDTALTTTLPLGNETAAFDTQLFAATKRRDSRLMADVHAVTPSYFRLANISFTEGAPFRDDDDAVVINRTLSSAIFGGDSAVGKRISLCHGGAVVKGVVDTKPTGLFGETKPEIYLAYGALPNLPLCNYRMFMGQFYILSDLNQGAERARTTIANVAHADWPDAVVEFKPFRDDIWKALGVLALLSAGISSLGLVAILLMAGGTSGMLREDPYRSSREIAIKVALGASPRQILAQVGRPLAIVACVGLLVGAAGAWEAERLMRALSPHLVEGQAGMGVGFGGAALVLVAVGLATCWVPMSRAAHADPIVSLRSAEE